ncbi:mitochondrial outer membrane translocase complex, subunit Tom22 [Vararia minispora EC-137]|uniref:Mitochondrial outer membrane translocase complex, subunit Tom22 n=1 Tax=Vararia minispora EC-137 TaxID=1314806 RepID=A0ACB8QY06_9AGAM|nr:mitochondrial outer membrane translocase complex, subunit Tom22 [Vararia minispora EC-137]
MVKVEIVDDKETLSRGESPYSSPASSRTGSSASLASVESESPADESFLDRLAALRDIVPPATRHNIATRAAATAAFIKRTGKFAGNVVWVLTTSALLVGLPMALSLEGEAAVMEQEKAMLAQGGSSMLPSGSLYPGGALPQGQSAGGLTPPGF